MSGFYEVRLPLALAIGASGGPERVTDVVRLASGAESRNARWAGSRRRWEVGGATIRTDLAHELVAFLRRVADSCTGSGSAIRLTGKAVRRASLFQRSIKPLALAME